MERGNVLIVQYPVQCTVLDRRDARVERDNVLIVPYPVQCTVLDR